MIRALAMASRIAAVSIALLAPLAAQQLPFSTNGKAKPANEKSASEAEQLQAWALDARAQLAKFDDPANPLPQGVQPAEVTARRNDLEQSVSAAERLQRTLTQIQEAKAALDAAKKQQQGWDGFSAKETFSVLMVDDLRNQREAANRKIATHESTLKLLDRSLDDNKTAGNLAEEQQRRAAEGADKNTDPAAKWRLDSARFKVRAIALQGQHLQAAVALQTTLLDGSRTERDLLDRKLAEAAPKQTFSKDDLDRISKAADDRKAALQKDADALRKRLSAANAALKKAQDAAPTNSADPNAELARMRVDAAQTRSDALEFVISVLDSARQLETLRVNAYTQRMAMLSSTDGGARAEARHQLEAMIEQRLKPWSVYLGNELALVSAEQDRNGSRTAALAAGDPRLIPLQDQRDALWEKSEAISHTDQAVNFLAQNLQTWLADAAATNAKRPWSERAGENVSYAWSRVKRIWTYEVFHYDDATAVGGQRGVTLGRLLGALVFFGVGYWAMLWLLEKVQAWMVSHKRIAGAQANTIRRWMMTLIAFLLVLTTLNFLKIPLTVFAFFGGALAIGLGFGTQTLIKNFISGIILLFERKVRVGDILALDGIVGTVTEINTRSSIIRSGDGVETLVPNSVFLENKVTNWTHTNRRVRATIRVNVAYGNDPTRASGILLECAERHGLVLKDPAPSVMFEDFGADAMLFALHVWVELSEKSNTALVTSDLRFIIEKRFHDIGFAFPSKELRIVRTPKPDAAGD